MRRVAVITGARQGLGLASARTLAADGFDIAFCDLVPADEVTEQIEQELAQLGARTFYARLDLAEVSAHDVFLDEVTATLGPIECLVNNAGVPAHPSTDVLDVGLEAFDRSVAVNLRGTFFLSQNVGRRMLAAEHFGPRRSIITITSIAAEHAITARAQYCMTKSALSMMVKVLALRLAPHDVDVHEVRPGFMRTAMTASTGNQMLQKAIDHGRVPIPRWGEPEDVGLAVASLATGRLPYMTGQPVWVAGGLNIPRPI